MKRFLAFAAAMHVGFFVIPAILVFFGEWLNVLSTGGALFVVAVVIALGVAFAVKVYFWVLAKLDTHKVLK